MVRVRAGRPVTNAARHSGARHTSVSFTVDDANLRLEVADDRVGLPARRDSRGAGLGLAAGCRVSIRCLASAERNPLASVLTSRTAMRTLMAASKPGGPQLAIATGRSVVAQARAALTKRIPDAPGNIARTSP